MIIPFIVFVNQVIIGLIQTKATQRIPSLFSAKWDADQLVSDLNQIRQNQSHTLVNPRQKSGSLKWILVIKLILILTCSDESS